MRQKWINYLKYEKVKQISRISKIYATLPKELILDETKEYYIIDSKKIKEVKPFLKNIERKKSFKNSEMKKCNEEYGEIFSSLELNFNVSEKRKIDYIRTLQAFKSNNSLPYRILRYGLETGYKKHMSSMFKVNNPGKNHGGKLSPWSKKFIHYSGEKDYKTNLTKLIEKQKRTKKENPQNENTKIEYYLSRGYSEEEALKQLCERQNTRSLEKYIEKYGELEGKIRFKETINKWLETLNSKSQEEKNIINSKRAAYKFVSNDFLVPGNLYYVKITDLKTNEMFYKIGISKKSVKERFGNTIGKYNLKFEILFFIEKTLYWSFLEEQKILKEHSKNRITFERNGFFSTEVFNIDIFNGKYDYENN